MEMCYTSLAMITDYDVWADEPVDTKTILKTMAENADKVQLLLKNVIPKIPAVRGKCKCADILKEAGA
jgi:5'-methylthioadenosine phosphorylase